MCLFNTIHFSKQIKQDLTHILSLVTEGGIVVILEPHNKTTFGDKLMKNKEGLKRKIQSLRIARNEIRTFLKWCVKYAKASIIVEKETQLEYFVVVQKL